MAAFLASGSPLLAAEPCVTLDNKAAAALFDDWNFALSSLDANQVTQRYWPNAVLLPTLSNAPRTSSAMINDYFKHFLAKRPRGRIDTRTIQNGCNLSVDMGTYTFSLMDDKGGTSEVAARYTFVYQYRDGAWKILHHHSSAMPESGAASSPAEAVAVSEPAPAPAHVEPARADKLVRPKPRPVAQARKGAAKARDSVAPPSPAAPAVVAPEPEDTAPDVKTPMFANLASSPPPANFYPAEAARHKEHGNVNLKVCADGSGAVSGTPEILKSSGSKRLDDAALLWALAAKWVPATLNRRRVEGCTQVDVAFEATAALGKTRT